MNPELLAGLTGGLGTGLGAFFTWLFNKKRQEAQTKQEQENAESTEIDNEIKLANYYKVMLDDLGGRYETKYAQLSEVFDRKVKMLEDEIKLLTNRNKTLTEENRSLKKVVKELKEELATWEKR
ncbi:hypothetical protein NBRC110019_07370 [Neptunitalea chrysea]|uniref:Uncharacterized protein n=1 Tax=Neptunitalea chrysea TaxID=1647581 RepID=A0A9W6EVL8_9FLAO|nr:hypothetical protein [Neptunitalea chrysea]GLB51698.1 hypothetical protein NBRC110019_07370 [Neptunitalea chrysea]